MATMNSVDVTLSGQTGTGTFVGSTSPGITAPLINQINDPTFNLPVLSFSGLASAVNYIQAINSATGQALGFAFTGTDSNVNVNYTTKGTGAQSFWNGYGVSTQPLFSISSAATNTVNYITASGNITTASPTFTATGSDTNIGMILDSKGTGRVQIKGISTNTAQVAGYVGELLTAANLAASPIVFTNGVAKTLQSVTLTPGDWDVWGNIFWSGTTVGSAQASLHTTTNVMADNSLISFCTGATSALGMLAPGRTFLVSANTTVYLVGICNGTGTLNGSGAIYARRRS